MVYKGRESEGSYNEIAFTHSFHYSRFGCPCSRRVPDMVGSIAGSSVNDKLDLVEPGKIKRLA